MSTGTNTDPETELQAQRFRAFDGLHLPLGQLRHLAYCPFTGEAKVLGNATARVLQACRSAATLDEHLEALRRQFRLAPAQATAVRAQLDELAVSGLLVSAGMLIRRCRESSDTNVAAPPISSLGIFTHERPSELHSSLGGLAETCRTVERAMRFVVADGSDDPQARRDNERALAALKETSGCEISYIGAEEIAFYADLLSGRAHVAPDIVRFALVNGERCPVATGCNRNALLFATLGELTMQVDSDTECLLRPSPAMREGMTLTSEPDPAQLWCEGTTPADPVADGRAAADVFALHERLLGKSLAACLRGVRDSDVDTDRMAMSFLRRLRGHGGEVHVTALGMTGDPGAESALDLLALDGAPHDRLVRSADDYRRIMQSEGVAHAVSNATIGDGMYRNGANLGLDNRKTLPPFMPVQGNEVRIFAASVRAAGEGFVGHLPWTTHHKRPEQRQGDVRSIPDVPSGSIIQTLVTDFKQRESAGAERNLANLGSRLVDFGRLPPGDFRELVQRIAWTRVVQHIKRLEHLLAKHNHAPDFWVRDVVEHLSTLRQAVAQKNYGLSPDLCAAFGPEAAWTLMQRLVLEFGQLLEAWPHLRRTALELRQRGREIGRRI